MSETIILQEANSKNITSQETDNQPLTNINLVPDVPPLTVTGNLYCINIKWPDKNSPGNMGYMSKNISETYKHISRNHVNLKPYGVTFVTRLSCNRDNLKTVEEAAIKAALKGQPKTPSDHFIIVNHGAINRSHTSITSQISHNLNSSIFTGNHELGHQKPFYLLHSNVPPERGKPSSRDGTSFMSIYAAKNITAPQLYNQGWLNGQLALHDPSSTYTYNIYKLNSDIPSESEDIVKAVKLPRRDATTGSIFLSYPMFKQGSLLAIHQESAGKRPVTPTPNANNRNLGSLRLTAFNNNKEYAGYNFQVVDTTDDMVSVTVSPITSSIEKTTRTISTR